MTEEQEVRLTTLELHEMIHKRGAKPVIELVMSNDAPSWRIGGEENGKRLFLTTGKTKRIHNYKTTPSIEQALETLEIRTIEFPLNTPEYQRYLDYYEERLADINARLSKKKTTLTTLAKEIGQTASRVLMVAKGRARSPEIEAIISKMVGRKQKELFPESVAEHLVSLEKK